MFKRRAGDTKVKAYEKKEQSGLHHMNILQKLSYATLSVQQERMKEERKQTKILSYATQEVVLQSQFISAQKLAMIACPTYDEENIYWKKILLLMSEHAELLKKMSSISDKAENVTNNEIDLTSVKHNDSPNKKNKKTENKDKELSIASNKLPMNEIEVANSLTSLASSSTTSVNSLLQNTNNNKNMV